MDRKFLEDLGIEKETINKILDQNGIDITAVKTQLKTKDIEISTLRNDLIAANGKVSAFEKVDIKQLQDDLAAEKEARTQDKKDGALKSLFSKAGCNDVEYIMYKTSANAEFDENNQLTNADELLKATQESYQSHFKQENATPPPNVVRPTGTTPGGEITQESFTKMKYRERVALKRSDPEGYKQLIEGSTIESGGN